MRCTAHLWLSLVRAGEDLLVASADKPFRFPATFTFVVRAAAPRRSAYVCACLPLPACSC